MWVPIHDEEWDGDIPLGMARSPGTQVDAENATIVFKGNTLPWLVGKYEVGNLSWSSRPSTYFYGFQVRYHHDGKYNVMSMAGPLEIYGAEFLDLDRFPNHWILQLSNHPNPSPLIPSGTHSCELCHFAWTPTPH